MDRSVVALVAAHEESDRIASTVSALHALVDEVVVVDDGSEDATSSAALLAGATVLRASRRRGKGRALEEALERLPSATTWLLADADLADSAALLGPLVEAVQEGRADIAIAAFPKLAGGGFGIIKRAAARSIRAACGFDAREPLSGQRALTAAAPGGGAPAGTRVRPGGGDDDRRGPRRSAGGRDPDRGADAPTDRARTARVRASRPTGGGHRRGGGAARGPLHRPGCRGRA